MADIKDIKLLCSERMNNRKQANYSAEEVDSSIRNAVFELFGTDKVGTKEYKRGFRRYATDIYEIVEDNIDQSIIDGENAYNNFFLQFVDFKARDLGDTNVFYIPSKTELQVAKKSRGNWTIERSRIDEGKEITLPMSTYGIKVYTEFETFMAGRIDFPKLIAKMSDAFNKFIASLSYNTFATALTHLPTNFQHNGAYNREKVASVVQSVETANGGKPAILLGTKLGLAKLQASTYTGEIMSKDMKDARNRDGFLKEWEGHVCMEIPQQFKAGQLANSDGSSAFLFDDSQVYVITGGEKPIKLYYEGSEMTKSVASNTVNEDMTLEEEVIINFGISVMYDKLFGRINLA